MEVLRWECKLDRVVAVRLLLSRRRRMWSRPWSGRSRTRSSCTTSKAKQNNLHSIFFIVWDIVINSIVCWLLNTFTINSVFNCFCKSDWCLVPFQNSRSFFIFIFTDEEAFLEMNDLSKNFCYNFIFWKISLDVSGTISNVCFVSCVCFSTYSNYE